MPAKSPIAIPNKTKGLIQPIKPFCYKISCILRSIWYNKEKGALATKFPHSKITHRQEQMPMKMLWKLTKEAARYKALYVLAIFSTWG